MHTKKKIIKKKKTEIEKGERESEKKNKDNGYEQFTCRSLISKK